MGTKLYVGGLSYQTSQQALQDLFAGAGTVTSVAIITDRETGRSKGFGFVEMSTDEEAQNAISMFHGKEFDGRTLTVNEARPQEPRSQGGFNRGGGNRGGSGGGRSGYSGGGRRNNW